MDALKNIVTGFLIAAGVLAIVGLATGVFIVKPNDSGAQNLPIPSEDPMLVDTPTYVPPTFDMSSIPHQSYWYCWNNGDPQPHHLGHPVSGDHLCTDEELGH